MSSPNGRTVERAIAFQLRERGVLVIYVCRVGCLIGFQVPISAYLFALQSGAQSAAAANGVVVSPASGVEGESGDARQRWCVCTRCQEVNLRLPCCRLISFPVVSDGDRKVRACDVYSAWLLYCFFSVLASTRRTWRSIVSRRTRENRTNAVSA